jgi:aspartyl-tRNA(Asn)/glutamyl-tRNA(Gln) amidotransferase subunit A
MNAPHEWGVAQSADALQAGQISSVELTQHLLNRLAQHEGLGAVLHCDPARALSAALAADQGVCPLGTKMCL